ncbi:seipin-3 [Physcomitrium patens]|uniref:Seipin n=1 Tax=Physcomitrium patens TaxID=3218 RepID=A0A2K1KXS2_PHYPA|nr:seipin-2-like [Physcomitrium patens]PNR58549.1 hypothetical protein PHYPA_005544 [Physcomitrium patens]|eukprot:XP_024372180.1 seipin-2-like [Physcomitrella patens]
MDSSVLSPSSSLHSVAPHGVGGGGGGDDDDAVNSAFCAANPPTPTASTLAHTVQATPIGLTASQSGELSFGIASNPIWPSVSESLDKDERNQDADSPGSRVTFPKLCEDLDAELSSDMDGSSSNSLEGVKSRDEERVCLEEVPGTSGRVGVCSGAKDALNVGVLEDLGAASCKEGQLIHEIRSMVISEEAKMLQSGTTIISAEVETSSVIISNDIDKDRNLTCTAQEISDDWLGAEDVASSLNNTVQETIDFDHDTPAKTSNSREMDTKRVYTFFRREGEALGAAEEVGSRILSWPVGIAFDMIGFQVKLILQTVYFALWICSFSFSVITFPFRSALRVANVTLTTIVDLYTVVTQIRPRVMESVALATPALKQTTKKCGCGCLAAVYVMFILGSLLVPALFLDLFLVRQFIDEPVEFRQILHFDYREEHPSAIVSLLPPKVRAKAKGDAYPEKVLRARAIPLSHSLHVSIFLTLPESHYNRQLGMFQVSAELLSVRGQILKRASWPCMLRFQSSPVRYAKQVILGVPLVMGLSKESQVLGLRLFENEKETTTPTAMVRFVLESRAGSPRGQGLPEVYSAEAQVLSVLPWSKDLLRGWKWTFYLWSALSLFMFEVVIVLCCCHQVLLPPRLLQGITGGFGRPQETVVPVRDTPSKRISTPGRHVNFSDELPVARATREPCKGVDTTKERELLLSRAESTSSLTGPRLRRLSRQSADSEDTTCKTK